MKKSTLALAAMMTLFLALPLWACSVPVFRYALERWQADPYEVLIFHRGEMTAAQQELAKQLSNDGQAGKIHVNIHLTQVDLDADPDPQLLKIWESQESQSLPWLAVRYPLATRIPEEAFRGELTNENVATLMDSPARREIARRLLSGDTSVLVLLESGDTEKDDAAFKLVEKQATMLAGSLKLPEIADEDLDEVSVDPSALRLAFSTIRLSRKDPAEKMFVEMLLGSEEDLRNLDEPMAFPIFGRGRVLYALIGKGITIENIQQAGVDLTGPCTCTVKDQNPGVDLVMAVDWDNLIEQKVEIDKELPPLAGLGSFVADLAEKTDPDVEQQPAPAAKPKNQTVNPRASATKPLSEGETPVDQPTSGHASNNPHTVTEDSTINPMLRNSLIISGVSLIAIFIGSLIMYRKQT